MGVSRHPWKVRLVNGLIRVLRVPTDEISDGYHSFRELYAHRIHLYIALARTRHEDAWKTRVHSDGATMQGWFLLGIRRAPGKQISYHLPESYWEELADIPTIAQAPPWDGHSPSNVLDRLLMLS